MPQISAITEFSSRTAGLVLAGGTAQRLGGVNKATLRIGGATLLERTIRTLNGQCSKIAVAGRAETPLPTPEGANVFRVNDEGTGPAAAMLFAARRLSTEFPRLQWLLLVPVDAPFAPKSFVQRAGSVLTSELSAIVGAHSDRAYPTHSLWKLEALVKIADRNPDTANQSLFAILDMVKWQTLSFDQPGLENPFVNINTPADLVACIRRARHQSTT